MISCFNDGPSKLCLLPSQLTPLAPDFRRRPAAAYVAAAGHLRQSPAAAAYVCRSRFDRRGLPLRDGGISLLPIDDLTWHNLFKGHPELAFDGFTYIKIYNITGQGACRSSV